MKIDLFRVKKMSVDSSEYDTEEYIATVDMEVVPRVGEVIYYYDTADKDRSLFSIGVVKKSTLTVERVVHFTTDGKERSIEVASPHNPVALFVS